jgi:hypothetical protein
MDPGQLTRLDVLKQCAERGELTDEDAAVWY